MTLEFTRQTAAPYAWEATLTMQADGACVQVDTRTPQGRLAVVGVQARLKEATEFVPLEAATSQFARLAFCLDLPAGTEVRLLCAFEVGEAVVTFAAAAASSAADPQQQPQQPEPEPKRVLDLSTLTKQQFLDLASADTLADDYDVVKVSEATKDYFQNTGEVRILPDVDASELESASDLFKNCSGLIKMGLLDISNAKWCNNIFSGCNNLSVLKADVKGINNYGYSVISSPYYNCRIGQVWFDNFGYAANEMGQGQWFCNTAVSADPDSVKSVLYSLLEHSYDRVANPDGIQYTSPRLSVSVKGSVYDALGQDNIDKIAAKGYDLNRV